MEGDILKRSILILSTIVLSLSLLFCAVSCNNQSQKDKLSLELDVKIASEGYTSSSYALYLEAYEQAKAVYESKNATALEIDRAIENLNKAKNALVRTADFSQLALAISDSEGIDSTLYTAQTYETFLAALNNAKEIYSKDTSKQSEINSAITSLKNAKSGLIKIPSTSSLQQLLQNKIDSSLYTGVSYAIYENAYDNASMLVSSGNASQSDLLLAENLLKQAITALVKRGDTAPIQILLVQLENGYLKPDAQGRLPKDRYAANSYAAFLALFEKGSEAVRTGDVSPEDVQALLNELNGAPDVLVDMSPLLDRIDLLGNYSAQSHFYTEESYDALLSAVSAGIAVVKAENSTKDQVEGSVKAIDDAISLLVRRAVSADYKKDKLLFDKMITVGNSSTTLAEYFADYTVFFGKVESENMNFAYRFVSDNGVEFSVEQVKVLMKEGYLKFTYEGGYPVDEASLPIVSFNGIGFDHTEFDVSSETKFGAPTDYSKRTEVIFGSEHTIAILSYENEDDGLKVVFEYNTIGNYISSIEFIRLP